MRLGTETGSVINHVMARGSEVQPVVGMGATVLGWTDRHAGTIVEVSAKGFTVQRDHARRTDRNGMSEAQEYAYSPNPRGSLYVFKRVTSGRAKGQWREGGKSSGSGVVLDHRESYHDFSF